MTNHPEHGVILADSEGMVLYLFAQDEEGESVCYDDCADTWPPPTVPEGLPGEFDTTERDDGSMQVTSEGMPLYYFANDEEPGDTSGQGVGDAWFVVNPSCPAGTDDSETTPEPTTEEDGDDRGRDGGGYGGPDY